MKTTKNQQPVLNEETELNGAAASGTGTKKNKTFSPWKSVLIGGVPGILIGSMGTLGVEEAIAQPIDEPVIPTPDNHYEGEVQVAHSVNDEMSYSEAFAAARAEIGPGGAFVWHGHVYGTFRGDDPEWLEMSNEDRAEHSQWILSQVHAGPYTPSNDEPEIVENPQEQHGAEELHDERQNNEEHEHHDITDGHENETNIEEGNEEGQGETVQEGTDEETTGEIDVHIVGLAEIETEDGAVQVGYGEVDGQNAMFADVDGDGEVDTVLIDLNDNGELDDNEIFDIEGSGVTMADLAAEAELNSAETLDDHLYGDMPDYTNDADTSSLV